MKVIVVNDLACHAGGSHRVAIDTCIALAEAGIETQLIHSGHEVDPRLTACSELQRSYIGVDDVLAMGRIRGAANYLWSRKAYHACKELFTAASQQHPRCIVHVHSYSRRLSPSIFAAARLAGLPIVHTLHDYFLFSSNGLHFDFRRDRVAAAGRSPWQRLDRRWGHHWLRTARMMVGRRLGLLPDVVSRFVAVSHGSRAFAAHFLPPARISTIYSPVAKSTIKGSPWCHDRLVFVGRISQEKGVFPLARVATELGLPLRFVGDGPDAEHLRTLHPEVEITGWLDQASVLDELLQARSLVLPSRWHETFGLCVAEALRAGVPAVVSQLAGCAEWITHGEDGLLFDPYVEGSLRAALMQLHNDQLVRNLSENGYENFQRRDTSREKYAAELISVYHEVLGLAQHTEQEAAA